MKISPHPIDADDAQTDLLHLSLSEISALSWRALRGAGRTWGEAEEGAEATCWLARAGLDWVASLTDLLCNPLSDMRHSAALCPLRTGMMLADFAGLPDGPGRDAEFRIQCAPEYLLPFLARVVAQTGQGLAVEWDGARAALAPDAAPALKGGIHATGPVTAHILPLSPSLTPPTELPRTHRASLTTLQYQTLCTIALNFTVPTSSSSQAGAGAQGGDDD